MGYESWTASSIDVEMEHDHRSVAPILRSDGDSTGFGKGELQLSKAYPGKS